jgi:hypothetical protein
MFYFPLFQSHSFVISVSLVVLLLLFAHMIMNIYIYIYIYIYMIDFFLYLDKLFKKKKKILGEICAKSPIQHNTGPCDDADHDNNVDIN